VMLPNTQIVDDFMAVLPSAFLSDLTAGLIEAWRETDSVVHSAGIHPRLVPQNRGVYRKGILDSHLIKAAKQHFMFDEGIAQNVSGSHCYAEIVIDETIILTTSVVGGPAQLPRFAQFRVVAAAHNPEIEQLEIFPSNVIQTDFVSKRVQKTLRYGIVTLGPSKSTVPEFIKIVIPDGQYRVQIGTIDLLARFSKPYVSPVNLSPEEIQKPAARLRIRTERSVEGEDKTANEASRGEGEL